jgi:hypothetical protein
METTRSTEHPPYREAALGHAWDLHWVSDRFRLLYSHCERPFSPELRRKVVADLQKNMPDYGVEQYFESQKHMFDEAKHLAIGVDRRTNEVVSMFASRWSECRSAPFMYFWTGMIGNDYRGTPLFVQTRAIFYNGVTCSRLGFPNLIATKTYNPTIYKVLHAGFCRSPSIKIYPDIYNVDRPDVEMRALARELAGIICPGHVYLEDKSIVLGAQRAVAPDYFPYMQKTDDPVVWKFFSENVTRADQVLCVLRIPDDAKRVLIETNRWNIACPDRATAETHPGR